MSKDTRLDIPSGVRHEMLRLCKRGFIAFCGGGILACVFSCKVGPNYQRPDVGTPDTFKSETQPNDTEPSSATATATATATAPTTVPTTRLAADWWRLFGDPQLNQLEAVAIEHNQNIQAAMARVLEARAAARVVKSAFYPTITTDPSVTRSRPSLNRTAPGAAGGNRARTSNDFQIPFDLTYEVDIWGRVRRTYDASKAQLQASADDFQVVLQTLEADVAVDYFNLRSLDAQDAIIADSVKSFHEQVTLTKKQQDAGLVGGIDLAQAEALLDSTITQEMDLRRQRADTEHALAVLLGRAPVYLNVDVKALEGAPPVIPPGLPIELLRRRPDVAEAEQNLVGASANVGVATANFYPVVTLTGAAGFESFDLQHLLDWQSHFWELGPNVQIPLFEGGKLTASLEQAKQTYNEFLADYRQQVLTAFQDVEDSLTDLHSRADEASAQEIAVKSSRRYLELAKRQYTSGVASYLPVIDADRTLLSNQLTAAQILNERMASTVLLMKAMGGGWDAKSAATTSPAIPHYPEADAATTNP